ncbi:MAG TPA: hypothetical protein VFB04_09805 [Terriglobales bacterium]|nr:hypothetical protein [Terriglobales bacterium]
MRRQCGLLVAAVFVFGGVIAGAQNNNEVLHARDFNARETISSIFISPLPNAPFQATVTAEWTKYLPDGTTVTRRNRRLVVRDSRGRIYQERRMLEPGAILEQTPLLRIEISDPVAHTKYFCEPSLAQCELRTYDVPADEPVAPVGQTADNNYLSRASLGSKTIDGLEAIGTRETVTHPTGAIGNSQPLEYTKEFWYSPKLGLNLQVTRLDPVHGDQFFSVVDLKLSEPDPRLFVLPPTTKVVDLRQPAASTGAVTAAH